MSKIGEKPITIPDGITIKLEKKKIEVAGGAGVVVISIPEDLEAAQKDHTLFVKRKSNRAPVRAQHGLVRSLIQNAVVGTVKPWEKRLEVVGTGYRVKLQQEDLVFEVGYSHSVVFKKAAGVSFMVEGTNKVIVRGVDKQRVGEIAEKIKHIKKPDPYKGKGIRYEGQELKLRPGKKAKTATGVGAK